MPTPVTDTKIEKNRVAKIFLSEFVNLYLNSASVEFAAAARRRV